jgi:7-cyano-7-deazaguanine reductase
MSDDLTQLGAGPQGAHGPEGLEAFPCSGAVADIELRSSELICRCPVTGQPDVYNLRIVYGPNVDHPRALETKSVKLWLWSYQTREAGVFAEDIAAELSVGVLMSPAAPAWVVVELTQNVRGGIVTVVRATQGDVPA